MAKKIVLAVMLLVLLSNIPYAILNVGPVSGWGNGGYSTDPQNPNYGTHDWIAQHALDWLPYAEKEYILSNLPIYLYGTELPDNSGAPDGIGDTVNHHIYYYSNGTLQDDASAVRAQEEYNQALNYIKTGNVSMAVKTLGIMSHYIVDVSAFGHVMGTETDWGAEVHHSDYEDYVNERTNNYTDEFNTYLVFDGSLSSVSPYSASCSLAFDTTFDGEENLTCVWIDQNYNWSDPVFTNRAGESLNLAVNYLADVLHTFFAAIPTQLYVAPTPVKIWTPAYATNFTIEVRCANVTGLYGFEFKLYWNTTLLDCLTFNITTPTVWGTNYFVIMNETREDLGRCWFAVSALSPAPSFNGNATLVKITFKNTYDPIYPNNVTCPFDLAETALSDVEASPIPHHVYDGEYQCCATKPRLGTSPLSYAAKILGEVFTVNITVADIVNLYSFEFQLSFNATFLDATEVSLGSFLKSPYHIKKQLIDDEIGLIWFSVESQAPASPANGSGTLATIKFKVQNDTGVWYKGFVPLQCDMCLSGTLLKTSQGVAVSHDISNAFTHCAYTPIPGDLNSDGTVNIFDLRMVTRAFGCQQGDPNWDLRTDLNRDGRCNLYDIVLVAKNYGRTTP